MEVKKVQEVKGSFYVYLPKVWCRKYISEEDKSVREVQLKINDDDSIIILPRDRPYSELLKIKLNLDAFLNEDNCLNSVLASYIAGIDQITLESETEFTLEFRNKISQLLNQLIGFEITQEMSDRIVIQEVSTTLKLDDMVRQLLNKVGLVLNYLADILETSNKEDAELVISQDDEIDKFRYSIERQVHQILRQPHLARELKITPLECLHLSQCTKALERIADHCTDISSAIKDGKKAPPALVELYPEVQELYMQMKKKFYPVEVTDNYEIITQSKVIHQQLELIEQKNPQNQPFVLHLQRICDYCSDIAEVRINSHVHKISCEKPPEN
jgi:phosphate uptake regulator